MNLLETLSKLVKNKGVDFSFGGKAISNEEVFSDVGLLPALAKRADKLSLLCLGYGIGVSFSDSDQTTLGIKVQFDSVTPNVLRLMFIYEVVLDLIESSFENKQVSLDELLYD